jgi:hypothetical protein
VRQDVVLRARRFASPALSTNLFVRSSLVFFLALYAERKSATDWNADGSGDLVARFIKINHEMRQANNKALSDLRTKTEARFLWSHGLAGGDHIHLSMQLDQTEFRSIRANGGMPTGSTITSRAACRCPNKHSLPCCKAVRRK